MKKIAILIVLMLFAMCCCFVQNLCFAESLPKPALTDNPIVLQNVIGRLMINDLQKAVDNYYIDYTDYLPQVEVYSPPSTTKILKLTFDSEKNIYEVVVEVKPYVAAHNVIGYDRITFEIDGAGSVTVNKFEHTKSFEYPPWLEVKLKKPFPKNTY